MKKLILTFVISSIVGLITSVHAQLLSFNQKSHKEKTQIAIQKKKIKDPHWRFSDYKPEITKKDKRRLKEENRKQAEASYSPKKSPYHDKKEYREAKAIKIRQERLNNEKVFQQDKKINKVRKAFNKKYSRNKMDTSKRVSDNKKNYGTKYTRKQSQTVRTIIVPKSSLNN